MLPGITRDSIMTIARDLGYEVREEIIQREGLYIADELFFVGTGRRSDADPVGRPGRRSAPGECGADHPGDPARFFEIVNGEVPDTHGWLQYLNRPPWRRKDEQRDDCR